MVPDEGTVENESSFPFPYDFGHIERKELSVAGPQTSGSETQDRSLAKGRCGVLQCLGPVGSTVGEHVTHQKIF